MNSALNFFFSQQTSILIDPKIWWRAENDIDIILYDLMIAITKKNKFQALREKVIEGLFISESEKERLLAIFSKIQFIYWSFKKLARYIKFRKTKIFDTQYDLYMNPLKDKPLNLIINIYDDTNGIIYVFCLTDLIAIANDALTNTFEFFANPKKIRNPYTNVPFRTSELYNIYFAIERSHLVMPQFFHNYFLCNFDCTTFKLLYECSIIDAFIKKFAETAHYDDKMLYLNDMIYEYNNILRISENYPIENLHPVLMKYLKDYLLSKYSRSPCLKFHCQSKMKRVLTKLKKENHLFGRTILSQNHSFNFTS